MAIMKFVETTSDKILTIPIVPGQYVVCTNTGETFYDDTNGIRIRNDDIIKLDSEVQREALVNPVNGKLYLCIDSVKLYLYYNIWMEISTTKESTKASMVSSINTITSLQTKIPINVNGYNKDTDSLMVFLNSTLLPQTNYTISYDSKNIVSTVSGWDATTTSPNIFNMIVFKNISQL